MKGRLAVIGDPIAHSLSPVIQNAMLEELGLAPCYGAVRVEPQRLAEWLEKEARPFYAGFNATMPHKTALLAHMDGLSADAKTLGAINTVVVREGKLHGHNTDGLGFVRALGSRGIPFAGGQAVLLGAGGAARSVALKLAEAGCPVTVCCRQLERAKPLLALSPRIQALPFAEMRGALSACRLLVNCTPLGMEGIAQNFASFDFLDALPASASVCDLIYRPFTTSLLAEAQKRGHVIMNGLGMLIHQGICALELFLDAALDVAKMAEVSEKAIRKLL
ncbi:MAG: shikimate dehydrogenase [Desulfovibrionaceae bacterium]|nr:shikimate dehydrogenase [Desulfovibrionaceae bacterium]